MYQKSNDESVIRNVWFLIQVRNKGRTVFKGEAVHDGHPIEPVLVAGFAHGEDARAIAQQSALQPAGDVPCAPENANSPKTYAVPSLRASLLLKLKLEKKSRLTFHFRPLRLRALLRVLGEVGGHGCAQSSGDERSGVSV